MSFCWFLGEVYGSQALSFAVSFTIMKGRSMYEGVLQEIRESEEQPWSRAADRRRRHSLR